MRFFWILHLISQFLICTLFSSNNSVLSFNCCKGSHFRFYSENLPPTARIPLKKFILRSKPGGLSPDGTKVFRKGVVVDCKPGTNFLVELEESKKKLLCSLSGRLYLKKVRIWNNSRVNVEVDLMFPEKGRIVDRLD